MAPLPPLDVKSTLTNNLSAAHEANPLYSAWETTIAVSIDFLQGAVVGVCALLILQILIKICQLKYKHWKYRDYDEIRDTKDGDEEETFIDEEEIGCQSADEGEDEVRCQTERSSSTHSNAPRPSTPQRNSSSSSIKSAAAELPVVRHCRLAVRAMLHLAEISPEVISQSALFADGRILSGRRKSSAHYSKRSSTTSIGDLDTLVQQDHSEKRGRRLSDKGRTRVSSGRKGNRNSLGRSSGAKAAGNLSSKRRSILARSRNSQLFDDLSQVDLERFGGMDPRPPRPPSGVSDSRRSRNYYKDRDSGIGDDSDHFVADADDETGDRVDSSQSRGAASDDQREHRHGDHSDLPSSESVEDLTGTRRSRTRRLTRSMTEFIGPGSDGEPLPPKAPAESPRRNSTATRLLRRRSSGTGANHGHSRKKSSGSTSESSSPQHYKGPGLDKHYLAAEHTHEWTIAGFGRVKFTDHAPVAFKAVRNFFKYSFEEINASLSNPSKVDMSVGKSDAVFFTTQDKRFLLKTLRGAEPDNLKHFLPDYLTYITKHPSTLLPRYLGMYTFERIGQQSNGASFLSGSQDEAISLALAGKFTVVLMASVFDTDLEIHTKFDFKGSNVGRQTLRDVLAFAARKEGVRMSFDGGGLAASTFQAPDGATSDAEPIKAVSSSPIVMPGVLQQGLSSSSRPTSTSDMENMPVTADLTLKEIDFQKLIGMGVAHRLCMGEGMKERVLRQLEEDVALLKKHEFMDYSLLIGVYRHPKQVRQATPPNTPQASGLPTSPTSSTSRTGKSPKPPPINIPPVRPDTFAYLSESSSQTAKSASASPKPGPSAPVTVHSNTVFHNAVNVLSKWIGAGGESSDRKEEVVERADLSEETLLSIAEDVTMDDAMERGENADTHRTSAPAAAQEEWDSSPDLDSTVFDDPNKTEQHESDGIPFQKRFKGGIRSWDFAESETVEYEVYFIGIIDILQKYNMLKWLERNFKRPIFSSRADIPTSLSTLFSPTQDPPSSPIVAPSTPPSSVYTSPVTSPVMSPIPAPVVLPGMENFENSVEEPGRYAERFVGFIRGVII
ncbi:uncharacterized protein SPPG_06383 [Spizellomyces punctatus DAOM BR117]|uniref:PIPK domain-containing protein n=1 Tax=Spizellomyces punctatus (strain DAOM BR117) TaxID=645134 RepID=A0A0L0HAV3_SPIPD|nr:uncharacterized protein SPPG_06383 [Spizellomyces punctatus DAOM BR117]KNC98705.1 hypothetical protein SPPG_06383 [Spizellomyces punctatus DAOM BR117]|eukprot:XP_016606745.1 hypothetical protein SPPG_06383 [Spizellomyces punctatus DAOM BR117]